MFQSTQCVTLALTQECLQLAAFTHAHTSLKLIQHMRLESYNVHTDSERLSSLLIPFKKQKVALSVPLSFVQQKTIPYPATLKPKEIPLYLASQHQLWFKAETKELYYDFSVTNVHDIVITAMPMASVAPLIQLLQQAELRLSWIAITEYALLQALPQPITHYPALYARLENHCLHCIVFDAHVVLLAQTVPEQSSFTCVLRLMLLFNHSFGKQPIAHIILSGETRPIDFPKDYEWIPLQDMTHPVPTTLARRIVC